MNNYHLESFSYFITNYKSDLNEFTELGAFMHTNNPSNGNDFTYGIVWNVRGSSSGYMIQYQFDAISKITKERYYVDGIWSTWCEQYLPISGGIIRGGLTIQPYEHNTKGELNSYDGLIRILSYESWNNSRSIFIQTHEREPDIANSVKK